MIEINSVNKAEDVIKELVEKLNKYTAEYDAGTPSISDKEWDDMYFDLVSLEGQYPQYILPDSPTQKVHYAIVNELKKVKHSHPMLSLSKTKDIAEVNSFIRGRDCIFMAKMDGLTVSLHYENGELVSAETRGNGEIGEDILHNARVISNIPNKINIKELPRSFTIDGEVICTYNDFEQFSTEYKNPRNFAAGSLRLLDSAECKNRNLTFVAWNVIIDKTEDNEEWINYFYNNRWNIDSLYDRLIWIANCGFTTAPFLSSTDVEQAIESIKRSSENLSYPIDGIVIKYDSVEDYEDAGLTAHHPRGALAYKFYDDEYETFLRDVEWGMGKSGQLTPVAIFDPVEIDGTMVERASLHNVSIMFETLHNPFYGQAIKVIKSNLIIPQVVWGEQKDGEPPYQLPKTCPCCGEPTTLLTDAQKSILMCSNDQCGGRLINIINHYCSKKGLDIHGLGERVIEQLIDWGWLNDITDIYTLETHREEWIKKSGWGVTSVDKILNNINSSKTCELPNFIAAISIPDIGITMAKKICEHISSYEEFRKLIDDRYDFTKWDGFSFETQRKLINFNYSFSDKIYYNYLTILEIKREKVNEDNPLYGKKIVITGKLTNFKTRDKAKEFFSSLGCSVTDTVTKGTFFLLNNDKESTTSKNKKAQQLNIPIYSEDEVINLFSIKINL